VSEYRRQDVIWNAKIAHIARQLYVAAEAVDKADTDATRQGYKNALTKLFLTIEAEQNGKGKEDGSESCEENGRGPRKGGDGEGQEIRQASEGVHERQDGPGRSDLTARAPMEGEHVT
jgi:hypothetical protein